MLPLTLILVILVAHFVADFVCQSDWMAVNKSTSWSALSVHVGVYGLVLLGITVPVLAQYTTGTHLLLWGVTNVLCHFVQDAVTSRVNAILWKEGERHWFFVGIGADQLLHYVTMFVTAGWWL